MSHCEGHTCKINPTSDLFQSIDELEFERGIWSAAQCGDLDRVQKLAENSSAVNKLDGAGYTALHYASRNGHFKICQYLLRNGAIVDAVTRAGQATSLHRAATAGHSDIVNLLLSNGADISLQDSDGKTVLHRAAEKGHKSIYQSFLSQSPHLFNVVDNKGKTASEYM